MLGTVTGRLATASERRAILTEGRISDERRAAEAGCSVEAIRELDVVYEAEDTGLGANGKLMATGVDAEMPVQPTLDERIEAINKQYDADIEIQHSHRRHVLRTINDLRMALEYALDAADRDFADLQRSNRGSFPEGSGGFGPSAGEQFLSMARVRNQ